MLLEVSVKKLNKRKEIPSSFQDKASIIGVVNMGLRFQADEVTVVPNPNLGKWFKDRDDHFYWGGGVTIVPEPQPIPIVDTGVSTDKPATPPVTKVTITPAVKTKVEQIINVFESGSVNGDYALLVRMQDHFDPDTKKKIIQVTYGRSQTTEFGHLGQLVKNYVDSDGTFAEQLRPYVGRIGVKPSLANDATFCNTLKAAGKSDPVMIACQDNLFDVEYYQPALNWFTVNGFTLPLSLLVIYDSYIHSGSILTSLRKKFPTLVPVKGGDEKEWITNYVNARHAWLTNNPDELLQKTNYRTKCFLAQLSTNNWDMSHPINANGVMVG